MISISPGEVRQVRARVVPPKTLKLGEYRAHISFKELVSRNNKISGASGKVRVGARLLLTQNMVIYGEKGKTKPNLEIKCTKQHIVFYNRGTKRLTGKYRVYKQGLDKPLMSDKIFLLQKTYVKEPVKFSIQKKEKYKIMFDITTDKDKKKPYVKDCVFN